MIWVTWRQQRRLVLAGAAVVAGVALSALVEVHRNVNDGGSTTRAIVSYLPAALGVFWGAPLLARPLQDGTAELIWAQRLRWLSGAVAVVAAVTLATAQGVRWILPGVLEGFSPGYRHDVVSVAALGYAVFAVALGVFTGAVLGRVEPAMAVTLLGYAAVRFGGGVVRERVVPEQRWESLGPVELGCYAGVAVLLLVATFVVVARRGMR
ncbi:hypothetical protein [Cryptosporangium sp. NPDC051539]|uniref:hypothetical protein n=1 Tax=Cryptosporangium sp. NPDC051539 TaxID=3363962 RepID=UPI0037A54018